MTVRELYSNVNALGIGVGSSIADALDGADKYDERMCALINSGVADLNRIRPVRGSITVDLAGTYTHGTETKNVMGDDGTVDVFPLLDTAQFERIDAYSLDFKFVRDYGARVTGVNTFRVNCPEYVKSVREWNAGITDAEVPKKELLVTLSFRKTIAKITVNELPDVDDDSEIDDTVEIDLDEGLADLLPLYVASKLYLDEAPGVANQYRSEYEARREEIRALEYNHPGFAREITTNGW